MLPNPATCSRFKDAHFALAFARIENRFFVNNGWLDEGQLIRNAGRMAGIPGTIVQGRYDILCPAHTAYDRHQAWLAEADFRLVEGAGHAWKEPGILAS